jgi:predicted metal-dependent peptidase
VGYERGRKDGREHMSSQRVKRLERAQLQVLFRTPFFAPGVCKLPVSFVPESEFSTRFRVPSSQLCTALTDGKEIWWCEEWFDSLPDEVLPTVLCHEACHCMFGHLWRMPAGADVGIWNVACDHALNLMLKEFSSLVMGKGLADPFPFPDPQDAYCADPQFAGMAEEAIFAVLNNRPKWPGQQPSSQGKAGSSGKGQSGGQANKADPGGNGASGQAHSMPDFGQFQPKEANSAAAKQQKTDWDATMMQACAIAKEYGSLPGGLERYLSELVSPVVGWREVLRSWLREQCADDWDFTRPAMEYSGSEFILPSMHSEKMGPVVFASDWSGSTFGELVKMFHAEKQACLDDCRPSKLVDFGFDTRVVSRREYLVGDVIDPTIKGGGGTSFVEVLQTAADMWPKPKCIVVLTDLAGEFPKDDNGIPTIWVTWEKGATAPFGEVICAPAA